VRLLDMSPRRGKSQALNDAFPQLRGSIVILSDANTDHDSQAARRLAQWFRDPKVTAVCGRLVLTDSATGRNVDGLYWKYETFLKRQEGALGALLGANGAIYAIRKARFVPVPAGNVVDDFVIPLLARLQHGGDLVYDNSAVAFEETSPNIQTEFHRRSRIGAGGFGSLRALRGLLHPTRGWLCFAFVSHKLLRWMCPFFLLGLLFSSALLAGSSLYLGLFLAQVAFYAIAAISAFLPGGNLPTRILRLTSMFTSMNAALFLGFVRWVSGAQRATWRRTARSAQPYAVGIAGAPPSAGNPILP
jgi:cellulose synthase/poly-beta-1,6-N-acetylglucosamine synthase-like glycosyltransferase